VNPTYRPVFGLAASYRPDAPPRDMVRQLRRFGFSALELNVGYVEEHGDGLAVLANELEQLTFHLPQRGEYSALPAEPERDSQVLEALKRLFDLGASLGCRTFTFHVKNVLGQKIEQYWSRSVDFARKLGETAEGHAAVVGLENCYPVVRSGEVARRFFDEVDHPAVGLTLDTGHFWSALCEDELGRHKEDPIMRTEAGNRLLNEMCCHMAETVADRIVNIHIHNIRAGDWLDHQPVDTGIMRYEALFEILKRKGYSGPVIVEIRPTEGWLGFESSARFLQQFR